MYSTGVQIDGDLTVTGNATLSGNILGDRIQNGTTQIDIQSANGNANISVAGTNNVAVFASTGAYVTGVVSASGAVTGASFAGSGAALSSLTGANVTGTVPLATSATTAGTVTTAAQGNITSVGTLTSLAVTGTVTGVNIATAGAITGASVSVSGTVTGTSFVGIATSAKYADLAEKYSADAEYAPGTVVSFGGDAEVTASTDADTRVAGVVSTNPAYTMNNELVADHVVTVAFTGRVPCRVTGTVRKGDLMVSAGNGLARAETNPAPGTIIGKALANHDGAEGTIEVVVGRF